MSMESRMANALSWSLSMMDAAWESAREGEELLSRQDAVRRRKRVRKQAGNLMTVADSTVVS